MKKIQKLIRILLPLAFGIGIIMFLLQDVDKDRLMDTIKNGIHWHWVVISWGFAFLANIVRGIRWRQQLRTIGVNPNLHEMSVSFFGNYGLNLVFPRFGEFWRCNYIAQNNNRPFFSIGGTILSERLCDIICSCSLVLLALLLQTTPLLSAVFGVDKVVERNSPADAAESSSHWLGITICCVLVAIAISWYLRKGRKKNLYLAFKDTCKNLWAGFCSLKALENKWSYLFWSLLIWFLYYLNTLTQFYFFDFTTDLGLLPCLTVFVMGTVAQILPIQGGLGAWQFLVISALLVYGIAYDDATNFAIVAWLLEQLFVIAMGLYAVTFAALNKKKK